jgi:transposase InsO family protein
MVQTSEGRVGRDATDGLNSTLDVATGQPRGAPMKHGGRVLGALFDKAEARMLSLGFIQLYVLVIVRLARRELVWINVTAHPTAEWIAQQLTEAFPWNEVPRYLIRDRDAVYGAAVTRRLRAIGIRDKPIAPGSPWQNGYAERLIGTIRRECLDHMIAFGEVHLRRILGKYVAYYNESRIHRSLNKDAPFSRAIEHLGVITSRPVLGRLLHQYCRI